MAGCWRGDLAHALRQRKPLLRQRKPLVAPARAAGRPGPRRTMVVTAPAARGVMGTGGLGFEGGADPITDTSGRAAA
jgi:hypothetical protein